MEQYAIPSLNRPDTLERKTLRLLDRLEVARDQIDVWVDPEQRERYEQLGVNVRPVPHTDAGPQRVGRARNAIARGYPVGTRLIEIDDDVTSVCTGWKGRKLADVSPEQWRRILDYAWATCDFYGLWLWGPYPVFNDYFMRPNTTTDLRYATGTLFGTVLRHDECELVDVDDKEDFQRCIEHTIRDGGLLRLNWLSYETRYYHEDGGMQTYRTPATVTAGAKRLAEMYPALCKYAPGVGKDGYDEVKLLGRSTGVASPLPMPAWVKG